MRQVRTLSKYTRRTNDTRIVVLCKLLRLLDTQSHLVPGAFALCVRFVGSDVFETISAIIVD